MPVNYRVPFKLKKHYQYLGMILVFFMLLASIFTILDIFNIISLNTGILIDGIVIVSTIYWGPILFYICFVGSIPMKVANIYPKELFHYLKADTSELS